MTGVQRSIRIAMACGAAVLAGCAKKDNTAIDTTAMATTTPEAVTTTPPAPTVNLADVAGTWNVSAVPATGDTTATTFVLKATAADSGWTMTFPGRKPMAVTVRTDGDSIMIEAGPFSSVRRKSVKVTTNSVVRVSGDNLTGMTTAHYSVKTADSVLTLTTTGTRAK
jgi:hypothetical protein